MTADGESVEKLLSQLRSPQVGAIMAWNRSVKVGDVVRYMPPGCHVVEVVVMDRARMSYGRIPVVIIKGPDGVVAPAPLAWIKQEEESNAPA